MVEVDHYKQARDNVQTLPRCGHDGGGPSYQHGTCDVESHRSVEISLHHCIWQHAQSSQLAYLHCILSKLRSTQFAPLHATIFLAQ